jgi:site-specific DNA recombinase
MAIGEAQKADPALLKAIARAHRWFDDLVTAWVASMAEIGKRESLPKNYVSWLIRLAFSRQISSRRSSRVIIHQT